MKKKLLLTGLGMIFGWYWQERKSRQPVSLQGAVTIVTGGANGIGKATAHCFARQGAIVVIADFADQLDDTLRHEFEPYTTPIHFIHCDITTPEQRQQLIDEVMSTYGHIDILINNAGISRGGAFADIEPGAIDKIVSVNLLGTLHMTLTVLPIMQAQNHGHIVNVSSISALMPPPGEAIYSATKSGLNAFSDSLRRELAKTSIRISVVMPALTRTGMLNDVSEAELRDSQVLFAGTNLDTAENVAEAILSAVQFNHRDVICGSKPTTILSRLTQLRPSAMDWAFKWTINTDRFMEVLNKLGEEDI